MKCINKEAFFFSCAAVCKGTSHGTTKKYAGKTAKGAALHHLSRRLLEITNRSCRYMLKLLFGRRLTVLMASSGVPVYFFTPTLVPFNHGMVVFGSV
jgi:hypothetical protein